MHLNPLSRTRRHRAALRGTPPRSNLLRLGALIGFGLVLAAGSLVLQPLVASATNSATPHVARWSGARASFTDGGGNSSRVFLSEQRPFVTLPTVTGISPDSGPETGGTVVTITGTNFTGATSVSFGGVPAFDFTVLSDTQITVSSPPVSMSGVVDVMVSTPTGTSATSSGDKFTFLGPPAVTSVSPTSGPAGGGNTVIITGTSFIGTTAVDFGTTAATMYTVNSLTSIGATSPAGSGTVHVTV